MTWEKSCGAVVYTLINGQIQYLLIQSLEGVYGFPKGHVESGETEEETALREVLEETHVQIRLVDGFRTVTEYDLPNRADTKKQVVFFLGEYAGGEIIPQKEELLGASLMSYDQAMSMLRFDDSRRILREANEFLSHSC